MNFDQEQSNNEITMIGEKCKSKEDKNYAMRKKAMTELKKSLKVDIESTELDMIERIQEK